MTGVKILIVEDDKSTSLILEQLLLKKNYLITAIVATGEDALKSIDLNRPHIILMDLHLNGEIDGIQTAEIINQNTPIPIVFISSFGDHKALLESKLNQTFNFLLKPVNENELEITIQVALYRFNLENKIKISERQFKMLADFSPDIIYLYDKIEKRHLYLNKNELFGYSKEEFLSMKFATLFFEEDFRRLKNYWKKVCRSYGNTPPSIEVRVKCKNQNVWEWANFRQSVIEKDDKGRNKLVLTVINNITEKKNAELDLIKTNFELDNFIYRASHDLSAPLKSIMGLVNLIKMEPEEERKNEYLDLINSSVAKMDIYIHDMTNYARNNRLEVANDIVNFEDIFEKQVSAFREKEGFFDIQRIFSVNQSSDFISDSLRVSIIFNNLISNAIKYQNKGRSDSFLKVSINVTKEYATIKVMDNGIGIKKVMLDKIFDMFYRATETSSGSGLGLYIAKQITHKLGGTIDVESEYGLGTTVTIQLPNRLKFISRY